VLKKPVVFSHEKLFNELDNELDKSPVYASENEHIP
jgi:hypothetical protein